jgi:alcohol dehydrogenase class IV
MQQYNFPTIMYTGKGALDALALTLKDKAHRTTMLVTDPTLVEIGLALRVTDALKASGTPIVLFDSVHPNPIEEDIHTGAAFYKTHNCDSIVALGGGSAIDAARVIKLAVAHDGPLSQYDDSIGGDKLIVNPMPPLYAIATTAGTGSEVGRSGVVILKATGKKTIFFAPELMPDIAVLDPTLTTGLPAHITAATGIDAFVHCLEAYFSPGFHPMADGIALEGIKLIVTALPTSYADGGNLKAREEMQIASSMGATAFQKGLGMIHSLSHPLSAKYNTHHGLANALLTPVCIQHMENSTLNPDQRTRFSHVLAIFRNAGQVKDTLAETCQLFFESLGINFGLENYSVPESDLEYLSQQAIEDPCHQGNMIPVTRQTMLDMYRNAFSSTQ